MRIAIVKLSAMGDIIHAMVALQYIKLFKNDLKIDWIVEEGFSQILEGNPDIHRVYAVNLKGIKTRSRQLFSEVKRIQRYALEDYDLVIDAQGLIKSAIVSKLLGSNRAGFSKDSIRESVASYFYTSKVAIAYDANTIDRNVRVLSEPLGLNISKKMILDKKPFLFYKQDAILSSLSKEKKNIIFVISSTWESRNYPKEQFMEVANILKEKIFIPWGNEEEKNRAEWIALHSPYVTVLPKLNLNALKAMIGESDLLIGNDTGPTHIAWGMNVASITLFGPTPTNRVYETPINKVLSSDSIVNHYKLNKEDFSIREIPVEDIVCIAKKLLYA